MFLFLVMTRRKDGYMEGFFICKIDDISYYAEKVPGKGTSVFELWKKDAINHRAKVISFTQKAYTAWYGKATKYVAVLAGSDNRTPDDKLATDEAIAFLNQRYGTP